MTFSEKLHLLSRRRGQSLRAIALELHFDPSAPAQWKRRMSKPSPEISKKLADYLAVPIDVLLDDAAELPAPLSQKQIGVSEETLALAARVQDEYYVPSEAELDRLTPAEGIAVTRLMERTAKQMQAHVSAYRKRRSELLKE
jgi:transcriptional regulator with XRE-family HTH domain